MWVPGHCGCEHNKFAGIKKDVEYCLFELEPFGGYAKTY